MNLPDSPRPPDEQSDLRNEFMPRDLGPTLRATKITINFAGRIGAVGYRPRLWLRLPWAAGCRASTNYCSNMTGYTQLMPDLCETFRRQAGSIWNRMSRARSLGMALSEETITESALYEIALVHQTIGDIDITIATKPAESIHGADWEWWFIKDWRGVSYRVQAKRLFPDGSYRSLLKAPPNPYDQLDKLIRVAARDGHIPLYCFFNFGQLPGHIDNWKGHCPHSYRGPSF
jgi:hypothetical protein